MSKPMLVVNTSKKVRTGLILKDVVCCFELIRGVVEAEGLVRLGGLGCLALLLLGLAFLKEDVSWPGGAGLLRGGRGEAVVSELTARTFSCS